MKSPPRPKSTKLSETCPPPPETIHDKKRGKSYERHGLLGEVGIKYVVYQIHNQNRVVSPAFMK